MGCAGEGVQIIQFCTVGGSRKARIDDYSWWDEERHGGQCRYYGWCGSAVQSWVVLVAALWN
jgi:hypothetical protein